MSISMKKSETVLMLIIILETILYACIVNYSRFILSGAFILLVALDVLTFIKFVSIKMNKIVDGLNTTVQSLIDEKPCEIFSTLNDDTLSKLQCQILRIADILKAQTEELKDEKEKITAFISDIAHQIKTPLANLNIYSEVLLDESITEEERIKFIKYMRNQIEKLNWLTDSFIKMSRLEMGIIGLNASKASITQTVLKAISSVSAKAQKKKINITFPDCQNIFIKHDSKWTEEAIFNILDNAVKYSDIGTSVKVSIEAYELFCHVDIEDEGAGIAEKEINKLFQRFYRGKNAKDIEGVGIGLFISRMIITNQGGYIKVKPKNKKGTIFSVFLPI